jgi:ferredoxin-thioredoxin reductase catalytic subunit
VNTPPQATPDFVRHVTDRHGYAVNPDAVQFQRLVRHLDENKAKHGRYFCPCKQHYPLQPDSDPVCPCAALHDEIKQQGHCECHLFFSPEAAMAVERRPGLLANVTCPG